MDGPGLGDPTLQSRVLSDLAQVNRWTRTHQPILNFLQQQLHGQPSHASLRVLDVGCGEGDLLRAIHALAVRLACPLRLTGLDLQPDSIAAARSATSPALPIDFVCGDVLHHVPGPVDFIVSSQLAHHLDDTQLMALLRWMNTHARGGWCVTDLRRHWLPYLGFRWLARAFGWHRVVRLDGTLSIARSRTIDEWQALLAQAGVAADVRRHFPFRVTVRACTSGTGTLRADG